MKQKASSTPNFEGEFKGFHFPISWSICIFLNLVFHSSIYSATALLCAGSLFLKTLLFLGISSLVFFHLRVAFSKIKYLKRNIILLHIHSFAVVIFLFILNKESEYSLSHMPLFYSRSLLIMLILNTIFSIFDVNRRQLQKL